MNPLRVFEYIFEGGACYALIRYNDDMIMQAAGLFLLIGFTFRAVDEIRKDYIMNKKGVENVR